MIDHGKDIKKAFDNGFVTGSETARAEIRGYLNALKDTGIISDVQFRVLLIHYTNFKEVEDCEKV